MTQEVTVVLDDSGGCIHCSCSEVQVVYPDKYKIKAKSAAPARKAEQDNSKRPGDNNQKQAESGSKLAAELDSDGQNTEKSDDADKNTDRRKKKRRRGKRSKK